jgi:acyl carrier protein
VVASATFHWRSKIDLRKAPFPMQTKTRQAVASSNSSNSSAAASLKPRRDAIDRQEFCDFVVAFAIEKSGVDPTEVTWDTNIIGLLDSVAIFELFSQLENKYGVSIIPLDFDINEFTSTNSLYELCSTH